MSRVVLNSGLEQDDTTEILRRPDKGFSGRRP
jgi:hypothetical protein